MTDDEYRQILTELVDWLLSVENLAHDVYRATADALHADPYVADFVASLADNEAQHAELMAGIRQAVAEEGGAPPLEIRLGPVLRETVEKPLRQLQTEVSAGTITRERAIALIAEVEFTEWNEVFLYVTATLGEAQGREMEAVLATIQGHERRIEVFIDELPPHVRPDLDIAKLAKVWDVNLLVVDDNRPVRELVAGLLKSSGKVTTAENGERALDAARHHFFDAVVSDLQMPRMGGLDFYRQAVAEHPDLKNRFVFISGAPSPADAKYLEEQGLPLLMKPFRPQQLVEAVQDQVNSRQSNPPDLSQSSCGLKQIGDSQINSMDPSPEGKEKRDE